MDKIVLDNSFYVIGFFGIVHAHIYNNGLPLGGDKAGFAQGRRDMESGIYLSLILNRVKPFMPSTYFFELYPSLKT